MSHQYLVRVSLMANQVVLIGKRFVADVTIDLFALLEGVHFHALLVHLAVKVFTVIIAVQLYETRWIIGRIHVVYGDVCDELLPRVVLPSANRATVPIIYTQTPKKNKRILLLYSV